MLFMLRFQGCEHFRQRVMLSCLSGKPIRIDDIRADDEAPGLRGFEASFLRLTEKLSNGCVVEINETGAPSPSHGSHACKAVPPALSCVRDWPAVLKRAIQRMGRRCEHGSDLDQSGELAWACLQTLTLHVHKPKSTIARREQAHQAHQQTPGLHCRYHAAVPARCPCRRHSACA